MSAVRQGAQICTARQTLWARQTAWRRKPGRGSAQEDSPRGSAGTLGLQKRTGGAWQEDSGCHQSRWAAAGGHTVRVVAPLPAQVGRFQAVLTHGFTEEGTLLQQLNLEKESRAMTT